jgi:hypothetical protein
MLLEYLFHREKDMLLLRMPDPAIQERYYMVQSCALQPRQWLRESENIS